MDKRTRIAKLARSIRNRIEHDTNMLVTREPKLKRGASIYYKIDESASIEWIPMDYAVIRYRRVLHHYIIVRVKRHWYVSAGHYYSQQFEHLYVAQQALEALQLHWAKWCMVKGTKAEDHA